MLPEISGGTSQSERLQHAGGKIHGDREKGVRGEGKGRGGEEERGREEWKGGEKKEGRKKEKKRKRKEMRGKREKEEGRRRWMGGERMEKWRRRKRRGEGRDKRGKEEEKEWSDKLCPIIFFPLGSSLQIAAIPAVFHVGPLQLATEPVKNSLRALAGAWKTKFASFLHKQAKVRI